MKGLYLLFIVVLLAGGYFVFINQSSETITEVETNTSSEKSEPNRDVEQPSDSMVSIETEENVETSPGNDAGMEFPIVEDESLLESKTFNLKGFNFGYDVKEIKVKKGDRVTINLSVSDGFHDWVIDEFDAATERIREGGLTSVTFIADKTGTFEYYCSVGNHRAQGMVGKLIVE